jgi:hypothetical protein
MDRETVDEIKRHFGVVIEGQDAKFQLLAEGLGAGLDRLEGRMGGLETRLGGLETRLGGLETGFAGLDAKVSGLDTKVRGLDVKVGGLDTRVGGVESELRGLTQVVQLMYSEVTGRLKDHELRIHGLEHRQP